MIAAALQTSSRKTILSRIDDLPGWSWWLLTLAYIGIRSSFTSGGGIYGNIGDSDDVTRLIQVRELIVSGHWFDTTTMKLGGDGGMLSHWSRLVDLPLAVLIKFFGLMVPAAEAERLTHVAWPLMVLGALLWAMYRCVQTVAGPGAARSAMALIILTPYAWYQFSVGRIDHHNVMIAGTISATLLMWSAPQRVAQWSLAGALIGLALAVGYEALAPAVAIGVFAALWGLLDERTNRPAAAFSVALASVFTLSFIATISPARWLDIHCDAISLNMVVLISAGTAGLLVALGPGARWPMSLRFATIACFAAAGIAGFGVLEPKCLAGPMGQLPPLLSTIWMSKVAEAQSIISRLLKGQLQEPLALIATFAIALLVQGMEVRRTKKAADAFLLATLTVFVALACWQFKYVAYTSCLSLVPIAVLISRLGSFGEVSATTVRLGAIVFLNQSLVLAVTGEIDKAFGAPKALTEEQSEEANVCSRPDTIRDLSGLPEGRFASHIDMGAYIAGLTHHRALAAPYHRIPGAIIANYQIFSARDAKSAAAVLKQQNVDYVIICRGLDGPPSATAEWRGTLRADLVEGKAPSYLVPIPLPNASSPYRVWKVDRSALNLLLSTAAASKP